MNTQILRHSGGSSALFSECLCGVMMFQFYEADEQFRRQEAQLRSRLDQLEKESEQHQAVVDALTSKYTDAIEKLQSDKARLEVRDV